jgi:serine-type D-Ala-D-Ala carboxypeptidase/endopeptidase (penicillin-binding protein 4)
MVLQYPGQIYRWASMKAFQRQYVGGAIALGLIVNLLTGCVGPRDTPAIVGESPAVVTPTPVVGVAVPVQEGNPDPKAQAIVKAYVQGLSNAGIDPARQGVWIQSGDRLLAEHNGKVRLPAASLTKLATSLFALDRWSTDYHFVTRVAHTGVLKSGVLTGDLLIQGGGDPLYVWESAILLGNRLNQLGIRKVTGRLIIDGVFTMNFERDKAKAGAFLKQGLNAANWDWQAAEQFKGLPKGTLQPTVEIQGPVVVAPIDLNAATLIVEQQSMSLLLLLKQMNMYSNNIMAEQLADMLGGTAKMAQRTSELANIPAAEIQFTTGSGLGRENQLSPRTSCQILDSLGQILAQNGHGLNEILPIVKRDKGTLEDRKLPIGFIGKTGTLADISNLAGMIPAATTPAKTVRDSNALCVVIQNYSGDLELLMQRQESLANELKAAGSKTVGVNPSKPIAATTP